MSDLANQPAFPNTNTVDFDGHQVNMSNSDCRIETTGGMTFRQYAAVEMTKAVASNPNSWHSADALIVKCGVELADALIAQLEKKP